MPQPKSAQEKQVDDLLQIPKGAAAKLAYIQTHLSNVEKTGRNEHHKYNYMQEHGLIDLLRPFLRTMNCCVVLSPGNRHVQDGNRVTLVGSLTFIDSDAPAFVMSEDRKSFIFDGQGCPVPNPDRQIVANFAGEGMDPQDKATNKASTSFAKYALQKFFLVPTEHVDDSDSDDVQTATKAVRNQKEPAAPDVLKFLLDRVKQGIDSGNLDRNKVSAKLHTLKAKKVGDLDVDTANDFSTWLEAQLGNQ